MREEKIEQLGLFDDVLLNYVIDKPIRLISFFSGIEAQYKALKFVGKKANIPVESYKTCEWAYNSIIACNHIHNKDFTDYSEGKTKEEMINRIRGISVDYNKPLTDEQLNKKSLAWIKNAYNCCIANHNLVNIMNVKGKDLEIDERERENYCVIATYSFPCQDLSLAGLRKGMSVSQADGGTRSGLLWEVERILCELSFKQRPDILIMENVTAIHSVSTNHDFIKWQMKLEELGYSNYYTDLNAKEYGIPQNRDRTIMVSIKHSENDEHYNYKFPLPFERKYCLKDMLETNVDEKYFLSKKMIDYISAIGTKDFSVGNAKINLDVARPLTTEQNKRAGTTNYMCEDLPENADLNNDELLSKQLCNKLVESGQVSEYDVVMHNYASDRLDGKKKAVFKSECMTTLTTRGNDYSVCVKDNESKNMKTVLVKNQATEITKETDVANTLLARDYKGFGNQEMNAVMYIEKNDVPLKRGYSVEVKEENQEKVDKIDVIGNYSKSNYVQTSIVGKNGVAPTVTENHGQVTAIAIKNNTNQGYLLAEEGDGIDISTRANMHRGTVQKKSAQTLTCCGGENVGVVVKDETQIKDGNGVYLFNSEKFGGDKIIENLGPTIKANKVDAGVIVNDEKKKPIKQNLRIRKLTPKECMRLMAFQDCDTNSMYDCGLTNSAIYHCAGDSICVNVLIGVFAKLFGFDNIETENIIKEYIETIRE